MNKALAIIMALSVWTSNSGVLKAVEIYDNPIPKEIPLKNSFSEPLRKVIEKNKDDLLRLLNDVLKVFEGSENVDVQTLTFNLRENGFSAHYDVWKNGEHEIVIIISPAMFIENQRFILEVKGHRRKDSNRTNFESSATLIIKRPISPWSKGQPFPKGSLLSEVTKLVASEENNPQFRFAENLTISFSEVHLFHSVKTWNYNVSFTCLNTRKFPVPSRRFGYFAVSGLHPATVEEGHTLPVVGTVLRKKIKFFDKLVAHTSDGAPIWER